MAFKKEFIKSIDIKSNRFDFEPEITAKVADAKPYAYEAGNNIYFDVSKFPSYYDLSRKKPMQTDMRKNREQRSSFSSAKKKLKLEML